MVCHREWFLLCKIRPTPQWSQTSHAHIWSASIRSLSCTPSCLREGSITTSCLKSQHSPRSKLSLWCPSVFPNCLWPMTCPLLNAHLTPQLPTLRPPISPCPSPHPALALPQQSPTSAALLGLLLMSSNSSLEVLHPPIHCTSTARRPCSSHGCQLTAVLSSWALFPTLCSISLFPVLGCKTQSQNILGWKGPAGIIESSSWLHSGLPKSETPRLRDVADWKYSLPDISGGGKLAPRSRWMKLDALRGRGTNILSKRRTMQKGVETLG